jgi:hypothetical protein
MSPLSNIISVIWAEKNLLTVPNKRWSVTNDGVVLFSLHLDHDPELLLLSDNISLSFLTVTFCYY